MKKCPVAIVLPDLNGGGAERKLLDVAQALLSRGRTVDLVLLRLHGSYRDPVPPSCTVFGWARRGSNQNLLRFLRQNRKFCNLPAHRVMTLLNWSRYRQQLPAGAKQFCTFKLARDAEIIRRYIELRNPRALLSGLSRANWATVMGRDAASRRPTAVVSIRNNYNYDKSATGGQANLACSRILYPRADKVVGVSQGTAKCAAKVLNLSPDQVCHIYNGYPITTIQEQSRFPVGGGGVFGSGLPVILNASRLVPEGGQKDFETLFSAFAIVRESVCAKLVCLSVHPNQESRRGELLELAVQLGIQNDIVLLRFDENPFPYMRAASVLVLSSRWEGFPNVLVEAMTCGTPVVSTDCPFGPSEILNGGRYGKLVETGNPRQMADGILEVLRGECPDERSLQRRAAEFSVERAADEYEKILFSQTSQ